MPAPLQLNDEDYQIAASLLHCELAAIRAVAEVESRGDGFLQDGRPRILFEGHKFYKYTDGKYQNQHPTLCYPTFTRDFYCKGTAEQRGHGELKRFEAARAPAGQRRHQNADRLPYVTGNRHHGVLAQRRQAGSSATNGEPRKRSHDWALRPAKRLGIAR